MSKHNLHINRLAPSPVHFAKPQAAKAAASSCLTWMNLTARSTASAGHISHLRATEARSNHQNGVRLANHRRHAGSPSLRKERCEKPWRILGDLVPELQCGVAVLRNQSRGALWRHQRRIMVPAFHNKRIAEFVALIHSPIDQSGCRRLGG